MVHLEVIVGYLLFIFFIIQHSVSSPLAPAPLQDLTAVGILLVWYGHALVGILITFLFSFV